MELRRRPSVSTALLRCTWTLLATVMVVAQSATAAPQASPTPVAASSSAPVECRAAVLDVTAGEGITPQRAQALTDVVTSEVGAHMACSVISRAEIEALMNFEVSRQASGCDDEGCLAELGDALGVSRLVIGSAQRVDDATLISLRLVDMDGMRVLKRVTDSTTTDEAVLPFVGWLARRLVASDEVAGPRPVDDTVVIERTMSVWRTLAWAGVGSAAGVAVLGLASGTASLAVQETLPSLKSARGTDRGQVQNLEAMGPWLAGGANLGLYVASALGVAGAVFFFFPSEELVEHP
jgi:hypothetical protein